MDGRTRRRTTNDDGHDQQRSEYEVPVLFKICKHNYYICTCRLSAFAAAVSIRIE
jgi:hypothetical protein